MGFSLNPDSPQGFNERLNLQPQFAAKYEFLITRNPFDVGAGLDATQGGFIASGLNVALGAAGAVADVLITRLYVDEIRFPGGISFDYERVNGNQYVKDIVYPDEVGIKFIEDENGTVRRYLSEWVSNVAVPASSDLGLVDDLMNNIGFLPRPGRVNTKEGTYTFRDNQEGAKRTGMLLMKSTSDEANEFLPNISLSDIPYPRIMMNGLVIKGQPEMVVGHAETDPIAYEVTFSIDEIKIPLLI